MPARLYVVTDVRRPWRGRVRTLWVLATGTAMVILGAIDALICARVGIPRLGWTIPRALEHYRRPDPGREHPYDREDQW